ALELVVVDDGSKEPVEPIVRQLWPDATVLRYDQSAGQCQRRNDGFEASRGDFILQLDDDCCFNNPHDLSSLLHYTLPSPKAARPKLGAVFCVLSNEQPPPDVLPPSAAGAGCVPSFVGAAILFRADAVRQIAGYLQFFQAHGEEEEFALQLLNKGWPILYCPP